MKKATILTGAIILVALVAVISVVPKLQVSNDSITAGSVTVGNEYYSTSTKLASGASIADAVLKPGPGTLGSVVITGAAAGAMDFYDSASTTASGRTLVASFPASTAAGTYVFDIVLNNGLTVDVDTTVPTSTITFR